MRTLPLAKPAIYRLPLNWTMGGAWYVDVKITLRDGTVVRRRFPVDVK